MESGKLWAREGLKERKELQLELINEKQRLMLSVENVKEDIQFLHFMIGLIGGKNVGTDLFV